MKEKIEAWFKEQVEKGNIEFKHRPSSDYINNLLETIGLVEKKKEYNKDDSLTDSQNKAFELFLQGKNIFITGKGGTGKSYLTRKIISYCGISGRNTIVCAPTGIAAQNINGATIHSAFQCGTSIVEPYKKCKNKKKLELLEKTDVIIIDEISMCRLDVFTFVCNTLLSLKEMPQIIVVGDFYQLPPVLVTRGSEYDVWQSIPEYKDKLFPFESPLWKQLDFITIELQEQMRQTEINYINCLDDIRQGIPNFSCFKENQKIDETAITLCTTNNAALEINKSKINELVKKGAKKMVYKAKETGNVKESDRQTDKELELCEGARIVFITNDTTNYRYTNGEMATITKVAMDSICVKTDRGELAVIAPHEWTINEYESKIDKETKLPKIKLKKVGSFSQLPVKLAWAVTVHKSQGQTYDKVNVITKNFFAEGQMYVALSRCKTLDGIHIIGNFEPWRLKCNNKVKEFMSHEKDNTISE